MKPSWITRRSVHDLNDAVTCTLRRTGGDHQSAEHRPARASQPTHPRCPVSPGHVVRSWSEIAGGQAQSRKSRRGSSPGPSRSGEATPLHYHSPGQRFAALREPVLASASAWSSRRGVLARMSGSGSGSGGGGARGQSGPVPASARKLVQGLTEMVNRPEPEIYTSLPGVGGTR